MQFIKQLKKKIIFFSFIALFYLLCFTKQDLPVHCLKHEIVGKWVIKASDLIHVSSGHEMKCGHNEPSSENTSYLAHSPYKFINEFILNLKDNDEAEIENKSSQREHGKWTMVYDEGFNIELENLSFFAFSKYEIKKSSEKINYNSLCYSTCVGWYHNKDRTKWGCYQAFKLNTDSNKVTNYNSKNGLNIVEPSNISENILNTMMNMQFKSVEDDESFSNDKEDENNHYNKKNKNLKKNVYKLKNYQNSESQKYKKYFHSSFLAEQEMMTMRLTSSFKNHALYVSKLLEVKKNWSAAVDPNFSKMTLKELNMFAGQKSSKVRNRQQNNKMIEDISMFPKHFDWKKILKPAGSQGSCGSCYVYSTMRMIEARLKLKFSHDVNLSVQHSLDCSFYNQGCDGGYPYLVMKYSSEFELIPEICKPYMESTGICMENTCNIKELPHIYRTRNYRYVGGSYGKCSQKSMMDELYKNGPFVVSFEPDYNFMMYKSGIYHSIDEKTWINKGIPKPEWEKVDHSVLLVGWGEEESGEKFWILQNTWGPSWGENGLFRMKRGIDEFGIESICESADPFIIDNFTGKELDINKYNSEYSKEINRNDLFLENNLVNGSEIEKTLSNSNQDDLKSIFDKLII